VSWLLSCMTLYVVYALGNKWYHAWWVSFGNQFVWAIYALTREPIEWGLLPLCVGLAILNFRGAWKWRENNGSRSLANNA